MENEISDELMGSMSCPVCKGKLKYTEDRKNVQCTQCKIKYPVEDGIPIIMPPKAR